MICFAFISLAAKFNMSFDHEFDLVFNLVRNYLYFLHWLSLDFELSINLLSLDFLVCKLTLTMGSVVSQGVRVVFSFRAGSNSPGSLLFKSGWIKCMTG